MKKSFKKLILTLFAIVAMTCIVSLSSFAANKDGSWISAWGTAPTQIGIRNYEYIGAIVGNVTSRTVLKPTADGTKVRVRFTNYFGNKPLTINAASVALSTGGSGIDENSIKILTFDEGKPSITIPAHGEYYSDPVSFKVTAMRDIAVSIYIENFGEIRTMGLSGATSYIALGEDATRSSLMGLARELKPEALQIMSAILPMDFKLSYSFIKVVPCLATLDVYSPSTNPYSVVVVGDSTVSNEFPQYLAEQINSLGVTDVGVIGKGIIGNRLGGEGLGYGSLIFGESMYDRLDRDVISQAGVKYAIVKIGANDIMHPVCTDVVEQYPGIQQPTAAELIEDFKKTIKYLHESGIKVIVVGITQWKGNDRDYLGTGGKYVRTPEQFKADWQIALDTNSWLEASVDHDGYVSFNEISANPKDPDAFLPEYTIDGAHPSDTLQKIWGSEFPVSLIGISTRVGNVRLNKSELSLKIGASETLIPTILPKDAENQNVSWHSSNEKVAVVDANGRVTAIDNGSCTISCVSEDGGRVGKCKVNVIVPVSGVKMSTDAVSVFTTKKVQLSATVSPKNASNKRLVWTSGNEKIATVNSKGLVTGQGSGTVTIICKTVDGDYTAACKVTVIRKVEVERIELSTTSKGIWVNKYYDLGHSVVPSNATFKKVIFKSSDPKIATVTPEGRINAISPGTATITVTSDDNSFIVAKCKVTVKVKVTSVKLNLTSLTLVNGKSKTLVPTVYPRNATNQNVTWSSSNPSVAKVNKSGTITALKPGTVTITCRTNYGSYTATCIVKVVKLVKSKSVKIEKSAYTFYVGRKEQIKAQVLPSNATYNTFNWKSSNTSVAKVNSKGVVTPVSKGKATITCTTKDTGKKASCVVTVKNIIAKEVYLDKSSVSTLAGKSFTLKHVIVPADSTNKAVTYSSSNTKVAKVSQSGKVTVVGGGTAYISCKTASGNCVAKCKVVAKVPLITSIKFKNTSVDVELNKSLQLKPTVSPKGASTAKLKWESSNPTIAMVDKNGKVTGLKSGKVIITCKPADGGNGMGTFIVVNVVSNPVLGVKVSRSSAILKVGKTVKLDATVLPKNASNKAVVWSSSNKKIATVSKSGLVKGKSRGTCEIRVTTVDGNYKAYCVVYVA